MFSIARTLKSDMENMRVYVMDTAFDLFINKLKTYVCYYDA